MEVEKPMDGRAVVKAGEIMIHDTGRDTNTPLCKRPYLAETALKKYWVQRRSGLDEYVGLACWPYCVC